jgi:hypothetical protein
MGGPHPLFLDVLRPRHPFAVIIPAAYGVYVPHNEAAAGELDAVGVACLPVVLASE